MRALRREGRSTSGLYHSVRQARLRAPDVGKLRKALAQLDAGDMLMVTRLDRLARSTRDLLNISAAIAGKKAGFKSLGDAWAGTTTAHGRLMLTAHQQEEAIKRREAGEPTREIALSYNVSHSTIPRLLP